MLPCVFCSTDKQWLFADVAQAVEDRASVADSLGVGRTWCEGLGGGTGQGVEAAW